MAYTTRNTSGSSIPIDVLFKITSIDSVDISDNPIYCTGLQPSGINMRGIIPPLLQPIKLTIHSFEKIDPATLQPVYCDDDIVYGELHGNRGRYTDITLSQLDKYRGANSAKSELRIRLENTTPNTQFAGVDAIMKDRLDGQLYKDLYTVNLVEDTLTGGDEDLGETGTISTSISTQLIYEYFEPKEQYDAMSSTRKIGDAKLILPKDQFTLDKLALIEDRLENFSAYITVESINGSPIKYTLWEGQSVCHLQNHFIELYLKRSQQND